MPDFRPIHTTHLFPKLDALLIALLKSLQPEDWNKSTPAPQWTVKHVATHLLDGNLRALSMMRDGYFGHPPGQIDSYADLVKFLNQLNADFINAFRRVSPAVLVELLETSGKQFCEVMASLPPDAPALFSVAWAGQTESPNWFHVAREYTEKWHHQQQIRAAMGLEQPLYARELYYPFLQVSMYALPYQYRHVRAMEGDLVKIAVTGEGGGNWYLQYDGQAWELLEFSSENPTCTVTMEETWAWRIFMNAASEMEAKQQVTITGKVELGLPILGVRAVMV
jgi:uncharacterized protein (TIGR03083 family)